MRIPMTRVSWRCGFGLVLLTACREPTQITIDLASQLPCGTWQDVGLFVANRNPARSERPQSTFRNCLPGGTVGTVVVLPQERDDGRVVVYTTLGIDKPSEQCFARPEDPGCISAKRILSFLPHTRLRVPIDFVARCRGVACDDGSTCSRAGVCIPATLDVASCSGPDGCVLAGDVASPNSASDRDASVTDADATSATALDDPLLRSMPMPQLHTIAQGGAHACAVRSDGTVACWGSGGEGALGNGSTGNSNVPVTVTGIDDAEQVFVANAASSCAIRRNGAVACWGNIAALQFGESRAGGSTPTTISSLTNVRSLALGYSLKCALRIEGTVRCFEAVAVPTDPYRGFEVAGVTDAVQIASGTDHACALQANGDVICWGSNGYGQLGTGVFDDVGPSRVPTLFDAVSLGLGDHLTFVARKTGALRVWGGWNEARPTVTTARTVCSGQNYACFLQDNATVGCIGRGAEPLGVPQDGVTVLGVGSGVTEITCGLQNVCARTGPSEIRCWGYNILGSLGIGDSTSAVFPPTRVVSF